MQAQEKLQTRLVECEEKWGELANMNCAQERDGLLAHQKGQPDFYQLQKILQEALKNIDEEQFYTKHIFDRFDPEALVTTIIFHGSRTVYLMAFFYSAKLCQRRALEQQRTDGKVRIFHTRQYQELFYRLWYCVAISQVTFSGIIVELIWSYNSANFFFWLQVYSAYSLYQCVGAVLNSMNEGRAAAALIVAAQICSYLTSVLV